MAGQGVPVAMSEHADADNIMVCADKVQIAQDIITSRNSFLLMLHV